MGLKHIVLKSSFYVTVVVVQLTKAPDEAPLVSNPNFQFSHKFKSNRWMN